MKITIAGKQFEINPSWGHFEDLYKKYDVDALENQSLIEQREMLVDLYWAMLKRQWYGLKPFITKNRFKYNVTNPEMNELSALTPKLLVGEDKNLGNSA